MEEKKLQFWNSCSILLFNPKVVDKRIAGISSSEILEFNLFDGSKFSELVSSDLHSKNEFEEVVSAFKEGSDFKDRTEDWLRNKLANQSAENGNSIIWIAKLVPKNCRSSTFPKFQCSLLDFRKSLIMFWCPTKENTSELYYFQNKDNAVTWGTMGAETLKTKEWLNTKVAPLFLKWMKIDISEKGNQLKSLGLLDLEEYNNLYNSLKLKYGAEMVRIWPERTDPSKFVYEDVAIATYLLLLWKKEREQIKLSQLQSFVDLGCGNGLLVYILTQEGHPGLGLDLRKRGIWDIYPENVNLKVQTIIPSDSNLFPDYDWIIGNHSDELSPWIPVIAARSTSQFFVLPCCAFEFNGQKFQRRNCNKSQYLDFLDYVEKISIVCGFQTSVDRLKIPSTKRIAIIGQREEVNFQLSSEISKNISACINNGNVLNDWNDNFKPRERVEPVKNCTKVVKSVRDEIVSIVFNKLLDTENFNEKIFEGKWNCGGQVTLSEIAKLISKDAINHLKSECGGLQTLLRNNHQIFQVVQGKVQIRIPQTIQERSESNKSNTKERQFKLKACYFQLHHPQSCPLLSSECSYNHKER